MRTFTCACGSTIFFENIKCLTCAADLGWCPACRRMTSLKPSENGRFTCGNPACGTSLAMCRNYAIEQVCNRCSTAAIDPDGTAPLCDYCRFNDTIPDLTVPGNREMWGRLESAKRRLLYTLDMLKLPYGNQQDGFEPPLSFDFKADITQSRRWWWSLGKEERVYTGHSNGKVTINLREADTVEREKARVMFHEAHRTVIGHFRHEIGHYYWELLVSDACIAEFQAVFGNHENPSYSDSQQRYYKDGPPADWQTRFVSPYATMHPWEDFAESFATYLDMVSVLDTALNMDLRTQLDPTAADLPSMVSHYIRLGVSLNEMNRAMGLIDLVPEVFVPAVVEKLGFVHKLIRQAGSTSVPVDRKGT